MRDATTAATRQIDPTALARYQRRMRGELFAPSPSAAGLPYALVARCLHAGDAALAISLARDRGLDIVTRGGAPGQTGGRAGALLIDLSGMRQVVIDPLQNIARVEPGATGGEFAQAAAAYGLAASDTVLAFEVVSAGGAPITLRASEHATMFQALRDAGDMGIVTATIYQVGPLSALEHVDE